MTTQFKVGDWILNKYLNKHYKIEKFTPQIINNRNVKYYWNVSNKQESISSLEEFQDSFNLWQPQNSELCWLIDGDKVTFVKFLGFSAGLYYGIDLQYNAKVYSKICEPFIGEPPTPLKDKQ